ncbi:SHOCT domain-containing protein [Candidatus Saccharibacteria bacterium]|nr:SHOCT domain-containing protein [Candidatus Saccharibacteria bacterium]
MPGLLRGMARTAAVVGTANAVSHRQGQRYAAQDQAAYEEQQAQAAPAPAQEDPYAELEKLGKLKEQGILTQEEFDAKKKQILGI